MSDVHRRGFAGALGAIVLALASGAAAKPEHAVPSVEAARLAPLDPNGAPATVEFVTAGGHATFLTHEGESLAPGPLGLAQRVPTYRAICASPCRRAVSPGMYRLALARDGNDPVVAKDPVLLTDDAVLRGDVRSNAGLRVLGWSAFAVGTGAGGALVVAGALRDGSGCAERGDCQGPDVALIATGFGVMATGWLLGALFAFRADEAHITVLPMFAERKPTDESPGERLEGAWLRGSF